MNRTCCPLWLSNHRNVHSKILSTLNSARDRIGNGDCYIFFRADDMAVPGRNFFRLMELFRRLKMPISLAIVPAWLTRPRWNVIKNIVNKEPDLFCLFQHGWRHINHEKTGKKQEFGPARSMEQIREDLTKGRQRLADLIGNDFYPLFTPPWNRYTKNTVEELKTLGYHAISSAKSGSNEEHGFPDFGISIDLHTRRESDPSVSMDILLDQLSRSLSDPFCGIMIHHQRMNDSAFHFLGILMETLLKFKEFPVVRIKDLVKQVTVV